MGNFLERKNFTMHSGEATFFKIECDSLTDEEIETFALLISSRIKFGDVYGVPRGGIRIENALKKYVTSGPLLIVDDVLTRGTSMEEARLKFSDRETIGVVLFARNKPADWIQAVFQLWSIEQ